MGLFIAMGLRLLFCILLEELVEGLSMAMGLSMVTCLMVNLCCIAAVCLILGLSTVMDLRVDLLIGLGLSTDNKIDGFSNCLLGHYCNPL